MLLGLRLKLRDPSFYRQQRHRTIHHRKQQRFLDRYKYWQGIHQYL
ncbi:hypothetical protein PMIT1313_01004 [Prochlorococcus marinus str. MIT 1313]|nr:hypothetical protein PMIT1313_01004 [Prochlorococcus marinus str. MIT 1313]